MWRRLDQLDQLGLPIHLTEISAKMPDIAKRNEAIFRLLAVAYAHPAVDGVWLWGFSRHAHWLGGQGALIMRDNDVSYAQRWINAFSQRWTTQVRLVSDDQGMVSWEGYFGHYSVNPKDSSALHTSFLKDGERQQTVVLPLGE